MDRSLGWKHSKGPIDFFSYLVIVALGVVPGSHFSKKTCEKKLKTENHTR